MDDRKPVQMRRAKDGAKALVEAWDVDKWRGYGFEPMTADQLAAVADGKARDADQAAADKAINRALEVADPTPEQIADAAPKRGRPRKSAEG